jgi:hypothetical protein
MGSLAELDAGEDAAREAAGLGAVIDHAIDAGLPPEAQPLRWMGDMCLEALTQIGDVVGARALERRLGREAPPGGSRPEGS